jgi:hypothetical protein
VHFVYIDDSGDKAKRAYSALAVADIDWKDALLHVKDYRRKLKKEHGIFVTKELHATEFVAGRGKISTETVTKGTRCRLFRETLAFVAQIKGVRLFNAISPKAHEALIFERLMNRINTNMRESGSNALIIHDQGKDYTSLVRRLGVYNPIQSRYGAWPGGETHKNIPLENILEDIMFRDSARSYFIQLVDFCAYALFRCEYPLPSKAKYKLDLAFGELHAILKINSFVPQQHFAIAARTDIWKRIQRPKAAFLDTDYAECGELGWVS